MKLLQSINESIRFIENNLTNDICVEDVTKCVHTSNSHFQRIFSLVTGISIGEYIRNRRLSLAGHDILHKDCNITDIAIKYQYDTYEGFSKAFTRFHGMTPSKVKNSNMLNRFYSALTISISIQGGFDMTNKIINEFYWNDFKGENSKNLTDAEKYKMVIEWAGSARRQNPNVFDSLTEWILDDKEWCEDKLFENEQILMHGVLARFKEQNSQLRKYLKEIKSTSIVNLAVFNALDRFDDELSGNSYVEHLHDVIASVFDDFSIMTNRSIREQIAGGKTGAHGTDSVDLYGYVNYLKGCDASVQWALFMPESIKRQQNGFRIDSIIIEKYSATRFIGKEITGKIIKKFSDNIFNVLDQLKEYRFSIEYDILFEHHKGKGVDIEPWHGVLGRFMLADTPVPEGFIHYDFISENNGKLGPPYIAKLVIAKFSGDINAMHKKEGYDVHGMYDVTRNYMLGQGLNIPYPDKYWTAEVFLKGFDNGSTAYMFSLDSQE